MEEKDRTLLLRLSPSIHVLNDTTEFRVKSLIVLFILGIIMPRYYDDAVLAFMMMMVIGVGVLSSV